MAKILKRDFFARPADKVAPDLLGKYLVRRIGSEVFAHKITETEAYMGEQDMASHARFGKTKRNEIMYGQPGHFYVYLIYGMYWMLNIITDIEGSPSGVLVRGVEGVSGPGRVTKSLKIDKSLYGKKAIPESGLWVEDRGEKVKPSQITKTPRIGIDYSGPIWSQKLYRYLLK